MNLSLLFFAALRDLTGLAEDEIVVQQANLSVSGLKEKVQERFPRLTWEGVRVAVNEEFVTDAHPLRSGDVVAFIPPVSGG